MDKKSDILLRRTIKVWVNRQPLPENGRARLIWEAAHASHSKIHLPALNPHPQHTSYFSPAVNNWPQMLFTWINENSMQAGFQARLG